MLTRKRIKIYSRLDNLQKYIEKIDKRDNKGQNDWNKIHDNLANNFAQLSQAVADLTTTVRALNKEEDAILRSRVLLSGPGTEDSFVKKRQQTTISCRTKELLNKAVQEKEKRGWKLIKTWEDKLKERYIALLVEDK